MSALVDTNLLVRSIEFAHPLQKLAVDAIAALRLHGEQLCLVPQNLFEFWVVSTRPTKQNGLGMTVIQVAAKIAEHRQFFTILDDTPTILSEWERLVTQHQVIGKNAHDARLVAAMLVHGVTRLLTFNTQDFQRFPSIVVVSPQDVLQGQTPPTSGPSP
jgi:predicted nucleic acid-binding protein